LDTTPSPVEEVASSDATLPREEVASSDATRPASSDAGLLIRLDTNSSSSTPITHHASRITHHACRALRTAAHLAFAALVVLTLTTPSWRYGPFAWWPLLQFPELAGGPVKFGTLNLLPAVLLLSWLAGRWLHRSEKWQWGRPAVTLPLLGLTLLGLATLDPVLDRRTFIQGGGLALAWLVYLFALNERPNLTWPLIFIALVQGVVAIAQFYKQGDVGLIELGELPLDPAYYGVTVLWARDQPWLRAYGLTAHPNLLGAIMAAILLLLLPAFGRARGWRLAGLIIGFSAGLLALATSFSRAAGLAFIVGAAVWLILHFELWRFDRSWPTLKSKIQNPKYLLPFLAALLFLFLYRDLVLSRFLALNTPIEAESLNRRVADSEIAWELIQDHPWRGVGLGYYTDAAVLLHPEARRVHNVPLFVTAELGILGGLFWLWLALAPFLRRRNSGELRGTQEKSQIPNPKSQEGGTQGNSEELKGTQERSSEFPRVPTSSHEFPSAIAPWLAMLVIGFFDTTLWLTSNWQTAVLFALLAANLSRPVVFRDHES
jgi:hypothetical protein